MKLKSFFMVFVILLILGNARATISVTPLVKVIRLNSILSNTTTLTLNVSGGQADITLEWSNFTYTTLNANKTSWTNFQGTDTIEINVIRTTEENKSRRFELNFTCSTQGCNNVTAIIETRIKRYPYLLFDNISDTYCNQNEEVSPCDSFRSLINAYKTNDYYHPCPAMYYILTGSETSLDISENYLLNQNCSGNHNTLTNLCIIYDLIRETLNDTEDIEARNEIACLADKVYHNLNNGDPENDDVQYVDYDFKAYPSVAIAGILLSDYVDNSLTYGSTPEDWLKAGTDYLFINDTLHSKAPYYDRSLISLGWDNAGKDFLHYYQNYYVGRFMTYFHIYTRHFGNITSTYPITKEWILTNMWSALPNGYETNLVTGSNCRRYDPRYFLRFLDSENWSYVAYHLDKIVGDTTLPNSRNWDAAGSGSYACIAYTLYENESKYGKAPPTWTTHLDRDSFYQIFRSDWSKKANWLSVVTYNFTMNEARSYQHGDQMAFEYYSKGDYVLPDAGETIYRDDAGYGPIDSKGHNTIQISDNDGEMHSIWKSSPTVCHNPAKIESYLTNNLFDFIEVGIKDIEKVESTDTGGNRDSNDYEVLTHKINWTRSILFPNKEYFIVLDKVDNNHQRLIYNLFHLGSFRHNLTNDTYNATIEGDLEIEGNVVDWESQSFGEEVNIANGSELKWNTTNYYDEELQTHLYSIPGSEISIEKHWIRIGGYELKNEVDHPLVRFKLNSSEPLYRITAFYTRYTTDPEWSFEELGITDGAGDGSALRIGGLDFEDIAMMYSGESVATVGDVMSSDGEYTFVRNRGGLDYFFCRDCSE
ncbi:MAG: hypothetical protein DRO95_03990, partial [Candidatus Altiarchaeales archaeon]